MPEHHATLSYPRPYWCDGFIASGGCQCGLHARSGCDHILQVDGNLSPDMVHSGSHYAPGHPDTSGEQP